MSERTGAVLGGLSRRAWALAIVSTLLSDTALAWEQIDEGDGIRVYKKDIPNSDLVAFRGDSLIDAPIEKVLWVLGDNKYRTEWVDRLKFSKILEQKGPYEYIVYQHFGLPFPASDRDYVYRGKAVKAGVGKVVLLLESVEHPKAPETVGVRARLVRSRYELIAKGKDQTIVIVEIQTDPKGWIPSWLVNMIQKSWPRKTLTALKKQVRKPYVQRMRLPD